MCIYMCVRACMRVCERDQSDMCKFAIPGPFVLDNPRPDKSWHRARPAARLRMTMSMARAVAAPDPPTRREAWLLTGDTELAPPQTTAWPVDVAVVGVAWAFGGSEE